MSGIINKVKDAITGSSADKDHAGHTTGPHNTDTGNRVDPRVDSNSGYQNTSTTGAGTHGSSTLGGSEYGSGTTGSTGYGSSNTGPHNSNVANKLDPRVGESGYSSTGTHGSSNIGGSEYGSGTTGSTGYGSSNTTGPHSSNLANKLDPRVDSDDSGTSGGYGTTGSSNFGGRDDITNTHAGRTGHYDDYTSSTGTHGTHGSSTLGGSEYGQSGTTGYGSSNTGTGPHSSSLANKLDPRVDSTTGQTNQTGSGYGSTGTGYGQGNTGYDSTNTGVGHGTHGTHGSHHTGELGAAGAGAYGAEHERKIAHDGSGGIGSKLNPLGGSHVGGTNREGEYSSGNAASAYERNALGGFSDGAGGTAHGGVGSGTQYGQGTHGTTGQQTEYGDNNTKSGTTGPHSSSLLNKLDPRVKDTNTDTNTGRYE